MGLRFAGYAALFDRADASGDIIRPGAFRLAGAVPLLAEHRGAPVGRLLALAQDARGLAVIGRVRDPAAAAMLRAGTRAGLSFGYRARAARRGGGGRELTAIELIEISLVARPMQPLARVHALIDEEGER